MHTVSGFSLLANPEPPGLLGSKRETLRLRTRSRAALRVVPSGGNSEYPVSRLEDGSRRPVPRPVVAAREHLLEMQIPGPAPDPANKNAGGGATPSLSHTPEQPPTCIRALAPHFTERFPESPLVIPGYYFQLLK